MSIQKKILIVATILAVLVLFASCPAPIAPVVDPPDTTGDPEPDPDPGPVPDPQIMLSWQGTDYPVDTTVDIGWQFPGVPTPAFTILNTGTDTVVMSAVPPVIMFDDDATDDTGSFSIPTQPTTPVLPTESAQIEIAYLGGVSGVFNFKLRIRVDDLADDYTLAITGWAQI